MKDNRDLTDPTEARVNALRDAASRCETSAGAMWRLARDCDRWGMGLDSDDARRLAISERVHAVLLRAQAAGLVRGSD